MNTDTPIIRLNVLFEGMVQSVGFRYLACSFARELSLTGFVRNLPNGSVELEAQGSAEAVRKLISRLRSERRIYVTRVTVTERSIEPDEHGFRSKH